MRQTAAKFCALALTTPSLFGLSAVALAQTAELQGLSLEGALSALEDEGLTLFYSSDLIRPWMEVNSRRTEADPLLALEALLTPHGLGTRPGPGGSFLVVRTVAEQEEPPQTGSIFGVVSARSGQHPISGARVFIDESGRSTTTDADGRFLFTELDDGQYTVTISHPVFSTASIEAIEVAARQTAMTEIELGIALRTTLEEIVVAASQYQLSRSASATHTFLTGEDIDYLPDFGDDALRAVNRLPGTTATGVSARSNVRGGEVGETLVRFDSLRLYEPFHLKEFQSIFSTVDPRVVGSMDVYTGGFPAAFGDRMSSVIDVESLDPPTDNYTEVALSFFNSSVLHVGQSQDGSASWIGSIRRSNLDVLYDAFSHQDGQPRYLDAFAKFSYDVNEKLSLSGNYLYFADDTSLIDRDLSREAHAKGEDRYLWLRLDHTANASLSGETLVAQSKFSNDRSGFTAEPGVSTGILDEHDEFKINSIQSDWTWAPNEKLFFQFGGIASKLSAHYDYRDQVSFDLLFDDPGASRDANRTRSIQIAPSGEQYALYSSVRYSLTPKLAADFGLRWDKQTLDPGHSDTLGPRLGLRYQLAERTYLRASWGRFFQSQGINELQVGDGIRTFARPQRSDHTVIGIEHDFRNGLNLRLEAYDKNMGTLRPRFENLLNSLILLPELMPDRIRISPNRARARGVELFLNQRLQKPLTWWFGYSYSWVEDKIAGAEVLRSWDQTHSLSSGLNWDTPKWNIAFAVTARSGWPTTPVSLQGSRSNVPLIGTTGRNTARLDDYRSSDFRVTRKLDVKGTSLDVFFEVTNLFGRSNDCCTEYEIHEDTGQLEIKKLNYLPLIPSIGFVWRF
jgi:hypothetical protein